MLFIVRFYSIQDTQSDQDLCYLLLDFTLSNLQLHKFKVNHFILVTDVGILSNGVNPM